MDKVVIKSIAIGTAMMNLAVWLISGVCLIIGFGLEEILLAIGATYFIFQIYVIFREDMKSSGGVKNMNGIIFVLVAIVCITALMFPPQYTQATQSPRTAHFEILCDLEKEMGIAYENSDRNNGPKANVGGMITDEQYARYCEPLREAAND